MRTLKRCLNLLWVAFVVLPVFACCLWIGSGRETLTKPRRAVEIEVEDDLFGDSFKELRLVRGPIFGYYIGADAIVVTGVFSMALVGSAKAMNRRRERKRGETGMERNCATSSSLPESAVR